MSPSSAPQPGRPVRGSESGRPIMATFDLLGRRWMLQVIGELGAGALGFNEVQRRIGRVSSSVLATRLRELTDLGLATTDAEGRYDLTQLGVSLLLALRDLFVWSDTWAAATGASSNEPPKEELVQRLLAKE